MGLIDYATAPDGMVVSSDNRCVRCPRGQVPCIFHGFRCYFQKTIAEHMVDNAVAGEIINAR